MKTEAKPTPNTTNILISSLVLVFHLYVFIILPVFLLPLSTLWFFSVVPLFWLNITHWALIHEAVHKILHSDNKVNDFLGRSLGIMLGASLHVLRFGHLMHHKLNRDWQSEMVERKTISAKLNYYYHLTLGLYFTEMAASFVIAILPRKTFMDFMRKGPLAHQPEVCVAGERFFYERNNILKIRIDMLLTTALYTAVVFLYGVYLPALIAFVILRAMVISFMDNIYHYGTPADNSKSGKELKLPKFFATMLLNGNYHETHHLNPLVPWNSLPEIHAQQGREFDGRLVDHGFEQLKGPIVKAA